MRRSLGLRMHDFENEQSGLSIEMNYCCHDSTMSVKFITPFGAINVSPETGWRKDLYSFDADNITEAIKKGLKEKLPMIATGSLEPYITIMIDAASDGKGYDLDLYLFTMELDAVAICDPGSTGGDYISISIFQNRKSIEEFVLFLQDVKHARGRDDSNLDSH